jgi:hypothetical protein
MDRAPEAIAGMRVVMAEVGGTLARGGADEDEAEVRLELIGEFFQECGSLSSEPDNALRASAIPAALGHARYAR